MQIDFDSLFGSGSSKRLHRPAKIQQASDRQLTKQARQQQQLQEIERNKWKGPSKKSLKILQQNIKKQQKRFDLKFASFEQMSKAGVLQIATPNSDFTSTKNMTARQFRTRKDNILQNFKVEKQISKPKPVRPLSRPLDLTHKKKPLQNRLKESQATTKKQHSKLKKPEIKKKDTGAALFDSGSLTQVQMLYKELFLK